MSGGTEGGVGAVATLLSRLLSDFPFEALNRPPPPLDANPAFWNWKTKCCRRFARVGNVNVSRFLPTSIYIYIPPRTPPSVPPLPHSVILSSRTRPYPSKNGGGLVAVEGAARVLSEAHKTVF